MNYMQWIHIDPLKNLGVVCIPYFQRIRRRINGQMDVGKPFGRGDVYQPGT
jgi:hypothetical protein